MGRVAQMTAHHVHEGGIASGRPNGRELADEPEDRAHQPEPQAQADGSCQRAVEDGDRTGRAGQEDRFGQRAPDRRVETGDGFVIQHQTSAPPPNWKKVRKKLDAAKAIESPNTIWMRRRKPPLVSPKASARPVRIMTITDITLATGPWIESVS